METDIDILAQDVVQLLVNKRLHIATAESCTGGLISAALTKVSGASEVFDLGICTYANWAKNRYVDVPDEMLEKYGAVSAEVAAAMCRGIQKAANSDFGISVTGIAGPTGGTPEKPVGTVYIGFATRENASAALFSFTADGCPDNMTGRDYIRHLTVKEALLMLEKHLRS